MAVLFKVKYPHSTFSHQPLDYFLFDLFAVDMFEEKLLQVSSFPRYLDCVRDTPIKILFNFKKDKAFVCALEMF